MARFIIMSTLTDEGASTLKRNPGRVKEVNSELKGMGIQVVDQYVVLGNFDFLTIVEAPDENTIYKAVVEMLSRGSVRTVTFRALSVDEFIGTFR